MNFKSILRKIVHHKYQKILLDLSSVIIAIFLLSCDCKRVTGDDASGKWVSDIPFIINHIGFEIPHDNRIYESDNFLVFSDKSSDEIKVEFSEMCEQALNEILKSLAISDSRELGIIDKSSKIHVYTNKELDRNQMAFPYGFILYGKDSYDYSTWPLYMKERYYKEIKHETMHVVQFLLGVLPGVYDPDKWFTEGIAEYMSGGFFIPISSLNDLNTWKNRYQSVNPISVHRWSDLTIPIYQVGDYYPMFGLAVRYLFDQKGLNNSFTDLKELYREMSDEGSSFEDAFNNFAGFTLNYYETHFYNMVPDLFD